MGREPETTVVLVCAECGDESDQEARGWRAYLGDDDSVTVFCPACSTREFDIE
jgi:hypothetical protein